MNTTPTSEIALLNCPFCNGKAYINEVVDFNCPPHFVCFCDECSLTAPTFAHVGDLIEYWNTRATPPTKPQAGVAEAQEYLAWLKKTASDRMDNARIVGFEDCLSMWKAAQQCEVVEYTRTPSPALKLAVEALEFYADKEHWDKHTDALIYPEGEHFIIDTGDMALVALNKIKEMEN